MSSFKDMIMAKCEVCGKECKPLGLSAHKRLAHTKSGKEHLAMIHEQRKGETPWNKGLTQDTDARVKENSKKISESLIGKSHPHTEESRRKISEKMKLVGGGYRKGSGIGKSGWYNQIWCDSSWELAFILWCELHGKEIKRSTQVFEYELNGKKRKYHPDFEVDGKLVEIKGRRVLNDEISAKLNSCPQIDLLLENEMKPILSEVINIFGNDFIKLYETRG